MNRRLTDEEVATSASLMTEVATAIFASETPLKLEAVQASRPLDMPEYLGFKRHPGVFEVRGARFAHGITDMEALVAMHNEQIVMAAKVFRFGLRRRRPNYWAFTVEGYVRWLAGNDWYSIGEAPARVAEATRRLSQLLPASHPLSKQH